MGVPDEKKDLEAQLQQAVAGCDELILWLDCDREGEAIGFEVIDVCVKRRPRLRVRRARFSALIPADIHRAMRTLVQPDKNASDAVAARQEVDLRLGAAFTRLQTKTLQNRFEGLDSLLSYGPGQFPTRWVVEQRAERSAACVAEDFWKIELAHEATDEAGSPMRCSFNWARGHLFDRLAVLVLYEACVRRGVASIVSVGRRQTRKWRPSPLATVELQKDASRKLRIPSDKAMEIAEQLYQEGYLSYPRTETDKFTEGFDLRGLIQAQTADGRWAAHANELLNGGFEWPRDGGHDDNAHPPIHPVKEGSALTGDRAKLYEYVARRFLGCCSRDALGDETNVEAELAGERFKTSGLMVTELNFLKVYTYERGRRGTSPSSTRASTSRRRACGWRRGRRRRRRRSPRPSSSPRWTRRDRHRRDDRRAHQEGARARLLHEAAPGRRRALLPTPTGKMLLKGYRPLGFDLGPTLRAEMERKQNAVAAGQLSKAQCVREIVDIMRDLYRNAA